MNKDILLKKIKNEDYIWIINFIIVLLALLSNRIEEDYIINNNLNSQKIYKTINITILIVLFFIYGYLAYTRLENFNKDKNICPKKELIIDESNLIAAVLILIGAFIYLIDEIMDEKKIDDNASIL